MPIEEWIHTHPSGSAYFSGTDLKTLATWERFLLGATVLGNGEMMNIYFDKVLKRNHYQSFTQFEWLSGEEEE